LVTSCELVKIDPCAWLGDILGRIADHPAKRLEELPPNSWA
jgi:transposase